MAIGHKRLTILCLELIVFIEALLAGASLYGIVMHLEYYIQRDYWLTDYVSYSHYSPSFMAAAGGVEFALWVLITYATLTTPSLSPRLANTKP